MSRAEEIQNEKDAVQEDVKEAKEDAKAEAKADAKAEVVNPGQVFACECGFRGKAPEIANDKCPRCGKTVKAE